MTLTAGTKLGPYEIVGAIGAGGMGEVYRARDTKLHRDVAIKILPDLFAADPDRLARFEREAQMLAALNHPHIAQIHGLEEAGPSSERQSTLRALVMELVEGEDLSERLSRGPIPLDDALPIARQIADALEAAHERGIIHRDLKPANIKITDDGMVKVLDFGLAKPLDPAGGGRGFSPGAPARSEEPASTIMSPATRMGVILGTAAYMAPEQARGKAVDKRADIWAFGCLLYEMLTGKRPFGGDDLTDTLAAVVRDDPDWHALPHGTPPATRRLLRRCLEKDPKRRLRDIGDARVELDESTGEPTIAREHAPTTRGRVWWPYALASAAVAAALGAGLMWMRSTGVAPRDVRRYTMPRAGFSEIALTAISPDGRVMAFAPTAEVPPFELYLQSVDSDEPRLVGRSGATTLNPFFSPDSRWVAFFTDGQLVKVPVAGGSPTTLAEASGSQIETGAWGPDGSIVTSAAVLNGAIYSGLVRILPNRTPEPFTTVAAGEAHEAPEFTPDGRTVLFTMLKGGSSAVAAVSTTGGAHRVIVADARSPRYATSGHLLYQHPASGDLFAVPFDPAGVEVSGEPVRLMPVATVTSQAGYAISREGTIVYSTAADVTPDDATTLVWVDRSGAITPLMDQRGSWAQPRISPDGRTVLVRAVKTPDCHLWAFDLSRGTRTRVTLEADNHDAVWHPDGQQIFWSAASAAKRAIVAGRIDSAGTSREVSASAVEQRPQSWSRDGSHLLFSEQNPSTDADIMLLSRGSSEPRPFLQTRFREDLAQMSPDGRWVAYVSNESGRDEVYVRRFEGESGRIQISTDGGTGPLWSPDGRELFYAEGARMMVAGVQLLAAATATRPRMLFEGPFVWQRSRNYDIAPDGRRFVMVRRPEGGVPDARLRVIVNWPAQMLPAVR